MWYVIGSVAALLTSLSFVPQLVKMWRTRVVKDVSLATLLQFSLGVSLWLAYGVHLGDPIIISANGVSLTTGLIASASYLYCGRKPSGDRERGQGLR